MPSIQGSSRILNTSGINGLTGPTGALGPTGPTGSTGPTGPVGSSDVVGVGIISASTGASGWSGGSIGSDEIVFYLTDGTTLGISGARGATGDIATQDFSITNSIDGPGYGKIFSIKNGITAYFKSLTVTGKDISVGATSDYTILLDGITYEQGMLGNTGELVFNFSGASAQGALNTHWSGDELTARILTHREVKDGNNIVIGEVVNVRGEKAENTETIVGTADADGTAVSFTYITQHQETSGDPIVKGMVSAFHLGQTGNSDGSSADVIYEFTGLTYDSLFSGSIEDVGSCCFCLNVEGPDRSDCVDFVTRNYCDGIGGSFSNIACLNRPEGPSCYPQGACCLLGGCAETSQEKCDTYGGFFVDGHTCEEVAELGGCPEECGDNIGACCINNVCFELTEYQCSFEPNSFWVEGSCDTVNCCLETQTGACCLDEKCYNASALLCSQMASTDGSPGIFWGIGSRCAGPGDESLYYPRNCTQRGEGETTFGNCDTPPCEGCVGWTQEINNACQGEDGQVINICACDGVECPCDNGDGQYGCNVCGSNTQACSTIITADGSCWECCCESDIPDQNLGWCCNPKENETTEPPEDCLTVDEDGNVIGNCLWRCYLGLICGCSLDPWDECGHIEHCTTYLDYRCSEGLMQLLNLGYDESYFRQLEPYATQCSNWSPIAWYHLVYDNGGTDPNVPRYQWIFNPSDDHAPGCAVGHVEGLPEDWYKHCPEAGPYFPCNNQWAPGGCSDGGGELNSCISELCCTDVTTMAPGGGSPEPLPPRRSRRRDRGGGGGCFPSTEESCVTGGGDWYSEYSQCSEQCNVEDVYGACCYYGNDTIPCQQVEESFCPSSIGTFYPAQSCDVCGSADLSCPICCIPACVSNENNCQYDENGNWRDDRQHGSVEGSPNDTISGCRCNDASDFGKWWFNLGPGEPGVSFSREACENAKGTCKLAYKEDGVTPYTSCEELYEDNPHACDCRDLPGVNPYEEEPHPHEDCDCSPTGMCCYEKRIPAGPECLISDDAPETICYSGIPCGFDCNGLNAEEYCLEQSGQDEDGWCSYLRECYHGSWVGPSSVGVHHSLGCKPTCCNDGVNCEYEEGDEGSTQCQSTDGDYGPICIWKSDYRIHCPSDDYDPTCLLWDLFNIQELGGDAANTWTNMTKDMEYNCFSDFYVNHFGADEDETSCGYECLMVKGLGCRSWQPDINGQLASCPVPETLPNGIDDYNSMGPCCNVYADLNGEGQRFYRSICTSENICKMKQNSNTPGSITWYQWGNGSLEDCSSETACDLIDWPDSLYGACCTQDNCINNLNGNECENTYSGIFYPDQMCEGTSCTLTQLGVCCGGSDCDEQNNCTPRSCQEGTDNIMTEADCILLGKNDPNYPSRFYPNTIEECCGNCCWWGGDPDEDGTNPDDLFNCNFNVGCGLNECLFYHCEQSVDLNNIGNAPCYPDNEDLYQDVTWLPKGQNCSGANVDSPAGCPSYNELGCCSWLVEGDLNHQVTRCYCEQGDDDFEWYEGECTTTPDPNPTQACCVGQDCFDFTVEECNDFDGQLRGEGTSCNNPPAGESWCKGACCCWDGSCSTIVYDWICTKAEACPPDNEGNYFGTWQGYGTDCNSVQCLVQGACCNTTTNECTVVDSEANCDGNYMGDGSICAGEEGDYDKCGACCAGDSCNDNFTEIACSNQPNWEKFFMDQFCDDVTCSEPVGACCENVLGQGYFCSDDVTESQCNNFNQTWCEGESCLGTGGNGCGQCKLWACCHTRQFGIPPEQCTGVETSQDCQAICDNSDFDSDCTYYQGQTCIDVCDQGNCPACEEETQACCTLTGCVDVTEDDCINVEGGDPRGVGTTCSDSDICGGACCEDGTGVCVEFSYPSCGPNATWQGYGTSCNPNPCEDARGACCYKNNGNDECSDNETESSCSDKCIQNIFYTECKWQGAFTNCVTTNCGGGVSPP